ncbi:flagellar hook assembly protein FlgD [Bacillus altitudinis MN12]|uniref:Flagellar basal-body rod modification protein FlgD n=1 Tax=Bacillus aerius TaxID=293388 RepID=A0ABR6B098_9BACI|nr:MULTISPECIES: flagellar hook assembly protein FlgD [Bacillus]AHL71418.1 flagellar basal body rod modification protein [Bacillus pumilus]KML17922.1 flagellar basal body rod modification protein [Bacillus stratosphericus]MBX7000108.1 flagellar hook assembly protein FlgD [Bacillus aerophilus]ALM29373.1 flagellar basal body rod modification protein [Bacillus altitudinis]ALM45910.1 flagellar basal body rod modification protein [Bacillus altitudinis]
MATVDATNRTAAQADTSSTAAKKTDTLGRDQFLKILLTQLQNQDPTNPIDDREFVTQLATFSSLEQQMNMNESITQMNQIMSTFVAHQDPFTTYVGWIGKEVEGKQDDKDISGIVKSVKNINNEYFLYLEDGTKISPWDVTTVGEKS